MENEKKKRKPSKEKAPKKQTAKKEKKTKKSVEVTEATLPQNIYPMGQRVEENKNIYIAQGVYKEIMKFTKNKTTNESGGILVGNVVEELGKTNIIIHGFIEAKHTEATPTTLTFTHQTWEHFHNEVDKKFQGQKILGWIHTHPNFGIFLSDYDKFIHQNFFKEDYQIAYVVDPIQHIDGFYFWIDGKLERCPGFYLFDKNGKSISPELTASPADQPHQKAQPVFGWKELLLLVLTAAVIVLFFFNVSLNKEVSYLKGEVDEVKQTCPYYQYYHPNLIPSQNNAPTASQKGGQSATESKTTSIPQTNSSEATVSQPESH